MSLDFGSILSRAWKITWDNKILWVFGILASLGGGGGSNTSYNLSRRDIFTGPGGQPQLPPRLQHFFNRFDPAILTAIIIGLICLGLIIALVLLVLSVIGRGGLIGGVQLAEANGKVMFNEAWKSGIGHFWTLFLIGLIVWLVTLVLALVIIIPGALLSAFTFGIGLVCFLPLLCVFILAAIILSIIAYFAQIAAVVENLGVTAALSRAWDVIKANVGSIIVLGIILAVVGGVIGFVISLPLLVAVFPPLMGVLSGDETAMRTGVIIAVLCFVAYLPVLLVLGGVLQTWITSAWTLAYRSFTRPAPAPGPAAAPRIAS